MSKNPNYRPLIYICSPFSGDVDKNLEKARKYCRFAVDRGYIPIAPHLLFPQFMSEDSERDLALHMDIVLLGKSEEVWVFGESTSKGMKVEIDKAKLWRKPIRQFTEACEEVDHD
jgi:dienelactone hydrolase